MLDALRVLKLMSVSLQQGRVMTIPALSISLHLGFYTLEEIMERLASADLVRKAEGQGWLMIKDAGHVRATQLLHLFVLDRSVLLAEQGDDPLKQWLASCAAQLEQSTDVSLQSLFDRCL
jgi:DNA-binding IscR family transcriptional regulator